MMARVTFLLMLLLCGCDSPPPMPPLNRPLAGFVDRDSKSELISQYSDQDSEFKWADRVRITKGFYRDCEGWIVGIDSKGSYTIKPTGMIQLHGLAGGNQPQEFPPTLKSVPPSCITRIEQ